jgi:hypothetical protein
MQSRRSLEHSAESFSPLSLLRSHPSLSGTGGLTPASLVRDLTRRRSLWGLIALLAIGCAFGPVAATAN